jgi:uncharacterized protein (TIGR00251 family)
MKTGREFHFHDGKSGAAIAVRVTPKSSRNEITEITNDGTIRVRLTSSSHENQINQALISFLSEILAIKPSEIEIVAGQTGKDKLITILNLSSSSVQERIIKHLTI